MLSSKAEGKLWQFENFPGYFRLFDKLSAEKVGPDGTLYYTVMPTAYAIQWCGGTTCCRVCPCMYPSASRASVSPFVFFAMQWCGETTCCRICPCMYPSASRVSVRPFVFHHLLTTCGTVVGDVDNPGRHARETQSSANWCAGQYIGCLSSDAIGKVASSIRLDQQVSHLKFLLTNCMCVFRCHVCC